MVRALCIYCRGMDSMPAWATRILPGQQTGKERERERERERKCFHIARFKMASLSPF